MSILKSTNSGGQKVLTIQDILDRGWYFKSKQLRSRVTGKLISAPGFEDKTKIYYKGDICSMDVIQEGDQLVLEGVWTYFTVQGYGKDCKKFRVTKYVRPRTLHDFSVLESYFELSTTEARVENLDKLFSAGFTDTNIEQITDRVII